MTVAGGTVALNMNYEGLVNRLRFFYPIYDLANNLIPYMYGLMTKCEVKMTGYWPSSFFCVFMDRDEVEVHNSQKKNEANIQPS